MFSKALYDLPLAFTPFPLLLFLKKSHSRYTYLLSLHCFSRPSLHPPQSFCARMSLRLEHVFQIFAFVNHITFRSLLKYYLLGGASLNYQVDSRTVTCLIFFTAFTTIGITSFVLVYCLSPYSNPNQNVSSIRTATLFGL